MEQLNKVIPIPDDAMSDALDRLYIAIRRTFVATVEIVHTLAITHLGTSGSHTSVKSRSGLMKEHQIVRVGAFKAFHCTQAFGFFSATKVNLRNAP